MNRKVFFVIISGLMYVLLFPPLPTGFLAFFVFVFLWRVLDEVESGGQAAKLGYLWGFVSTFGSLWWVFKPTLPGMIGLVLFLSLFGGFYAFLHWFLLQRLKRWTIILSPFLWVAIEYIRSSGKLGFGWLNMCYSQTMYPPLIQIAELVGCFGVSLWIVLINACIYFILSKSDKLRFAVAIMIAAALFFGNLIYGMIKLHQPIEGTPIHIAILQGNVDPYVKWTRSFKEKNMELYAGMLRSLTSSGVVLAILPETATACYHKIEPATMEPLYAAIRSTKIPVFTGTLEFDATNPERYFNSAVMFDSVANEVGTYSKMQLVPFSEYIPLQDKYKFLRKINFGGSHFSRGEKATIFAIDGAKFGALICYESLFGWISREFRKSGAQFLVNITNDGWFGNTPGPYQHAYFNVMRAVECRCGVARSANTGVSMIIDPMGRIVRKIPIFTRGILVYDVIATDIITPYVRMGDWIGWSSLGISLVMFFILPFFNKVNE